MRTVRCSSHLPGGCLPRGVCQGGVCLTGGGVCPEGCLSRGCLPGGCVWSGGVSARRGGVWRTRGNGCLPRGCTPPPVDRILDTHLWKHYLSATLFADGNDEPSLVRCISDFRRGWRKFAWDWSDFCYCNEFCPRVWNKHMCQHNPFRIHSQTWDFDSLFLSGTEIQGSKIQINRMHSSRMRTARSRSCLLGGGVCLSACWDTPLQGVDLETPLVWAWRPPPGVGLETPQARHLNFPPGVGLETLQARPLNFPLGCGPGDPPRWDPSTSPRVWAWRPARHAGIPPPPQHEQTDTCKNITPTNFVCGR